MDEIFEKLRKKLVDVLENQRKEEEAQEISSMIDEEEFLSKIAGRFEDLGELEKAEDTLKQAAELINGLFRRDIEFARKEEPALPVVHELKDKATDLASKIAAVLRKRGKYFEAEMTIARGHKLLAEYVITVDKKDAGSHIAEARKALKNADKLRPYQPDVKLEMMELDSMLFILASRETEETETKYDEKKDKLEEIDKRIEDLKKEKESLQADYALIMNEKQDKQTLDVNENIMGDESANRNKRQEGLERIRRESIRVENEINELRQRRKKCKDEKNDLDKKRISLKDKENDVLSDEAVDMTSSVDRAFDVIVTGKYDTANNSVKKASIFLSSLPPLKDLPSDIKEAVLRNIMLLKRYRDTMDTSADKAAALKRREFITGLLLDIYFKDDKNRLIEAVGLIEGKSDGDVINLGEIDGSYAELEEETEISFLTDYLTKKISEKMLEDRAGLINAFYGLLKKLDADENPVLRAVIMEKILELLAVEGDPKLTDKENFIKEGGYKGKIKPEKTKQLEKSVIGFLKDKGLDDKIINDSGFSQDILSIIEKLKEEEKDWKPMNWQDRITLLIRFYVEKEQPEGKVEEMKRSGKIKLYSIMARSGDVNRRKAGIDFLGREEINKPAEERDNEALKVWADELLAFDKDSAAADYFKGVAAYRGGRRTEEGKEERQKGYSRLSSIEHIKKYLEKNKEDEDALLFLANIYWDMHREIYRYAPRYEAFDKDAACFFEEVSNHFMKKYMEKKKEKNKEEAVKALSDAHTYIDMAMKCDPRNGRLKNRKALILKKLGEKNESIAQARSVIKASREKRLFDLIATREDRSLAEHILAEHLIDEGSLGEALAILKRHTIRTLRLWRGGRVRANTLALLSLAYAERGRWRDKKKAAKYRRDMFRTGEDTSAAVDPDLLDRLEVQVEKENTCNGL